MSNQDWKRRSLAHVWHPCTQMQDHVGGDAAPLPLVPIKSAEGAWLEDFDGRRYLDAVGSWWTNIFGHRHPYIVEQLKQQLDTLDHVMLAGFTHAPVVELSERLVKLAPPGLTRCSYADNGSSAVEIALKQSFHYWRNAGHAGKTRFIALENGYHGETLGALAVGGPSMYRDTYAPLLLSPIHVPSPDCYERGAGESWEDYTRRQFEHMELALERHAHEVCAVILEPLVQCAGGMRMYHPIYLSLLREACDRHGVHLIADEIAVGFGRTGKLFACEWAPPLQYGKNAQHGITPDFLCL
jgi:adenosylmethionine---8-amino-7-oxononanoate aminotransferase